jgi:hypothetical protein
MQALDLRGDPEVTPHGRCESFGFDGRWHAAER